MDAVDEAFVTGMEEGHCWGFIDATRLGLDDPILDLIAHPESVAATDPVCFVDQLDL